MSESLKAVEERDAEVAEVRRQAKEEAAALRKAKSRQAGELLGKLKDQGMQLAELEESGRVAQDTLASRLETTEIQAIKSRSEAKTLQNR